MKEKYLYKYNETSSFLVLTHHHCSFLFIFWWTNWFVYLFSFIFLICWNETLYLYKYSLLLWRRSICTSTMKYYPLLYLYIIIVPFFSFLFLINQLICSVCFFFILLVRLPLVVEWSNSLSLLVNHHWSSCKRQIIRRNNNSNII